MFKVLLLSLESYPLPGVFGVIMEPMTLSVASVALRGSDSSQRSRILVAGAVMSS